jgi:hypothetical protein
MNDKKRKIGAFLGIIALLLVVFLAGRCVAFSSDSKTEEKVDSVSGPTLLMQLQRCSRLNTAEVKLHKIITHDDELKL